MSKIYLRAFDIDKKPVFLEIRNMFVKDDEGNIKIISAKDIQGFEIAENVRFI